MNKLLTIVIPTYNMQDYLHRCLDSLVLNDEQLMSQLEVLVVNDGSKDNSSIIAHEYETKHPKTFRVIDKENGNYGSCVNRGLKEATGKYIKVLDADDWFDTNEFARYLNVLKQIDVDLVLTPFVSHYESSGAEQVSTQPYLQEGEVYEFNTFPKDKIFRYSMHMVTYRTDMLRNINYRQTEGISYTDTEWAHIPQYVIKSFTWLNTPIYQYCIGREGQTMDASVLAKNIWKYEIICRSLIDNANKYPDKAKYPLAEEFNMQQIEFLATNIYRMFLVLVQPTQENMQHLKQFDAYLKEACPIVYNKSSRLPMKKWLPLRYVSLWRKTGIRIRVDAIREIYRKLKYGTKYKQ